MSDDKKLDTTSIQEPSLTANERDEDVHEDRSDRSTTSTDNTAPIDRVESPSLSSQSAEDDDIERVVSPNISSKSDDNNLQTNGANGEVNNDTLSPPIVPLAIQRQESPVRTSAEQEPPDEQKKQKAGKYCSLLKDGNAKNQYLILETGETVVCNKGQSSKEKQQQETHDQTPRDICTTDAESGSRNHNVMETSSSNDINNLYQSALVSNRHSSDHQAINGYVSPLVPQYSPNGMTHRNSGMNGSYMTTTFRTRTGPDQFNPFANIPQSPLSTTSHQASPVQISYSQTNSIVGMPSSCTGDASNSVPYQSSQTNQELTRDVSGDTGFTPRSSISNGNSSFSTGLSGGRLARHVDGMSCDNRKLSSGSTDSAANKSHDSTSSAVYKDMVVDSKVIKDENADMLGLLETLEQKHHEQLMSEYKQHQQRIQIIRHQMETQNPTNTFHDGSDVLQSTSLFIEAENDEEKQVGRSPSSSMRSDHTQYIDLPRPGLKGVPDVPDTPSTTYSFRTPTKSEMDQSEVLKQKLQEKHEEQLDYSNRDAGSRVSNHSANMDDPGFASNVRVNLREKHARHIADLKSYYEQEIEDLKAKLASPVLYSSQSPIKRLQTENRSLVLRCDQLEKALYQANELIKETEVKLQSMEQKITDWSRRYDTSQETIRVMQRRFDDLTDYAKQKEMTVRNVTAKLAEMDAALSEAYRLQDIKATNLKKEHGMLQKILTEYDVVSKELEVTKATLNLTENKLYDSRKEATELRRMNSKTDLELQRLSRENDFLRYKGHNNSSVNVYNNGPGGKLSTSTPKTVRQDNTAYTTPTRSYQADSRISQKMSNSKKVQQEKLKPPNLQLSRNNGKGDGEESLPYLDQNSGSSDTGSEGRPLSPLLKAERELNKRKQEYLKNSLNNSLNSTHERLFGSPSATGQSPRAGENSPRSTMKSTSDPNMERRVRSAPEGGRTVPGKMSNKAVSQYNGNTSSKNSMQKPDSSNKESRLESTLDKVKNGSVMVRADLEKQSTHVAPVKTLNKDGRREVSLNERMRVVADLEKRFDELLVEKRCVATSLIHVSTKPTRQSRQSKEQMENQLDQIDSELGSIRMALKRYHVLK